MDATQTLIYGERVADLVPVLVLMGESRRIRADGMHELSWKLPSEEAAPLLRALLRAEAELALEDADALGTPGFEERTSEQRAADALLRLIRRLAF